MLSFDFFPEILQRKITPVSILGHVKFIAHFRQILTSITLVSNDSIGHYQGAEL